MTREIQALQEQLAWVKCLTCEGSGASTLKDIKGENVACFTCDGTGLRWPRLSRICERGVELEGNYTASTLTHARECICKGRARVLAKVHLEDVMEMVPGLSCNLRPDGWHAAKISHRSDNPPIIAPTWQEAVFKAMLKERKEEKP